jgi:predicted alpha/beta hydrolase family esterase
LLRQLEDQGVFQKYREIYFIAHSMGGLIVKRMLVDLHRPKQVEKLRQVKAVLYISTPAQGANSAVVGSWLSLNPQLRDMRTADLNSFLRSLEDQWQDLMRERKTETFPLSFCAYETKPTHGITIVNRVYASTTCDHKPFPIDEDHGGI